MGLCYGCAKEFMVISFIMFKMCSWYKDAPSLELTICKYRWALWISITRCSEGTCFSGYVLGMWHSLGQKMGLELRSSAVQMQIRSFVCLTVWFMHTAISATQHKPGSQLDISNQAWLWNYFHTPKRLCYHKSLGSISKRHNCWTAAGGNAACFLIYKDCKVICLNEN